MVSKLIVSLSGVNRHASDTESSRRKQARSLTRAGLRAPDGFFRVKFGLARSQQLPRLAAAAQSALFFRTQQVHPTMPQPKEQIWPTCSSGFVLKTAIHSHSLHDFIMV